MDIKNNFTDVCAFTHKKNSPFVKITDRGILLLNHSFMECAKKQLSDMKYAKYYFSKLNNSIVITFNKDGSPKGSFKITRGKSFSSICATSFLKYYFKDRSEWIGHYEPKLENIPNIGESWVIYLNNKIIKKYED